MRSLLLLAEHATAQATAQVTAQVMAQVMARVTMDASKLWSVELSLWWAR